MCISNNSTDPKIIQNMKIHYSGLIKEGATGLGWDSMARSIFNSIDKDRNGKLSAEEISEAMPELDTYITQAIENDDFYAQLFFGEQYSEGLKNVDPDSDKTPSAQIVENNLNYAAAKIFEYAKSHPEDTEVQKYAQKLEELLASGDVRLTDIESFGIAGRACKDENSGKDIILIDNHDSSQNLNRQNLLQTLLHELRHTLETDNINSKAEELEAQAVSIELANKIDSTPAFYGSLSTFLESYNSYPEASPGTYNIPPNTGIAVWYKPDEVVLNGNQLVIKSEPQKDLNGARIADCVNFGGQKDENGNPFPVSAERYVIDNDGKVIFSADYGEYDMEKRQFNYFKVKCEQDLNLPGFQNYMPPFVS